MILDKFIPDYYFDDVYVITPEFLEKLNITALICDIDNTLEPYEEPVPTPRLLGWINELRDAGVQFAFVSNNHAERVELFNRELGFFAIPDSGKPSSKPIKKAMDAIGVKPENAAMLGDQVFTDVLAGKNAGLRTILVKPIRDKKTLFFRFKRWLEKPVLRAYARLARE